MGVSGRAQQIDPMLAELRDVIAEHAALLVEHSHDIAEIMAHRPRRAPPGLLPLKQAAADSGFSARSLTRWARAGTIVGLRRGGRWYLDSASLRAFIATRR